jgi:predicted amidohydrolase
MGWSGYSPANAAEPITQAIASAMKRSIDIVFLPECFFLLVAYWEMLVMAGLVVQAISLRDAVPS